MLKLNVNQEKQLTFEVQIGGVQSDQVSSHLRIEIDDVEYGFPAQVGNESISVNLPPLRTVTARKLKEGEEVQVKLEIIADGNYLTPWQDTFRLSNPLVVEAKIVDDEFTSAPAFKTKLVSTKGNAGDQSQGVMIEQVDADPVDHEEALTEKIANKLAEKLAGQALREEEGVEEFIKRPSANRAQGGFGSISGKTTQGGFGRIKGDAPKKKLPAFTREEDEEMDAGNVDDTGSDSGEVEEFIRRPAANRAKGGFGRISGKSTEGGFGRIKGQEASKKLPAFTREDLMNMTEEDVFAYMSRAGTSNPTIQKIIYEQAEAAAQSSVPVKVLQQVIKIMKAKR